MQADGFSRLSQVRSMHLAEEQWEALGKRLSRLERLVEAVPEVGASGCPRCRDRGQSKGGDDREGSLQ